MTFTFTELVKEAYNAGDSTPIHLREKLHRKMILTRGKYIDCPQEKGKPRGDVSTTVIEMIKKKSTRCQRKRENTLDLEFNT